MLWLPFVAVLVALVFERIYRSGLFLFSSAILAAAFLVVADYMPLDSSISPVVAVLRSNLWLTIHVLTVVGSYAPIGLAAVLAHLYGILYLRFGPAHPKLPVLDQFIYRATQVGVVLLAAGIMLGAVWANASWGRYWGWDPKETWALITLLWYLGVFHGKFAGWLKGAWTAVATITGFFLVLMTYYGVSFYLVGLHSYAGGNAKPFPLPLIIYLAAELVFIAAVSYRAARSLR
jgi:ABC-type transport system involved in cytochrome c biogenesis permease subunit